MRNANNHKNLNLIIKEETTTKVNEPEYTVPEVARILRIAKQTTYERIAKGEIKAVNYGERQIRVRESDLAEYKNKKYNESVRPLRKR